MRRIVIWLASTVTVVVLLFGYHTSTNTPAEASSPAASTAPATSSGGTSGGSSTGSGGSPDPSPTPSSKPKTYTGDVASTRWGPVQVAITVANGTITKVAVPHSPDGNPRDGEINARALPVLTQETIDAQSAKIDMVSGATVTSDGYVQSLQSALDAAGL